MALDLFGGALGLEAMDDGEEVSAVAWHIAGLTFQSMFAAALDSSIAAKKAADSAAAAAAVAPAAATAPAPASAAAPAAVDAPSAVAARAATEHVSTPPCNSASVAAAPDVTPPPVLKPWSPDPHGARVFVKTLVEAGLEEAVDDCRSTVEAQSAVEESIESTDADVTALALPVVSGDQIAVQLQGLTFRGVSNLDPEDPAAKVLQAISNRSRTVGFLKTSIAEAQKDISDREETARLLAAKLVEARTELKHLDFELSWCRDQTASSEERTYRLTEDRRALTLRLEDIRNKRESGVNAATGKTCQSLASTAPAVTSGVL